MKGSRTYLTGAAMIVFAALGVFLGHLEASKAVEIAMEGFGLIFLRSAVAAGASPKVILWIATASLLSNLSNMTALAQDVRNPFAKQISLEVTPSEVLASVRVGGAGSGTVIIRGETNAYVLSCHHVVGTIDQEVALDNPDGSRTSGRVVATDPVSDLTLIRTWSTGVLGAVDVADRLLPGTWTGCGYPRTQGPNYTKLEYRGLATSCGHEMFSVRSGYFAPGNSGGGLFSDGMLVGVTGHGDEASQTVHATAHGRVLAFLNANCSKFTDKPCPDGNCPNQRRPNAWTPTPNVPIKLPRDGTFPDRESSKIIVELSKRLDALEAEVAGLKKQLAGDVPPPPGERGAAGDRGPKGDNATDAQVAAAVAKWVEEHGDKWLDDHREHVRGPPGRDGSNGKDGKPGVITVILQAEDGQVLSRAENMQSGSVARLKVNRFKKE